ncbi:MAG: ABC transporter permease [Saprospiraceae bacterium]|nr:ABC transporter permease [Saprospiraceae bacterium]
MKQYLRIIFEGAAQAWQQLTANKLRSFLSLLGVTIGIFCIIGVKSAINSLEDNIRGSMEKLGNDVIYLEKGSWSDDGGGNFWKWMKRPNFSFAEYEALKENLTLADKVGFWKFLTAKTIKWRSSSVENAVFLGITEDCNDLFHLEFEGDGRFITPTEYQSGAEVCIIGHTLAEGLFGPGIDPVDKEISVGGRKLRIIGALKPAGKDLLKPFDFSECVLVSYTLARRGFGAKSKSQWERTSIMVQAKPGADIEEVKDEIIGEMRASRRLKPVEENNFALNTLSILSGIFDNVFSTLNAAGFIIGIFALIVGMFSVANIMFVSVKERTNIIGIKMALGAKRWFILLEILIEAMVLCLVGGMFGLMFIWIIATIITHLLDFDIYLSFGNIMIGVVTSLIVGVLSGLIPASQASRMDPVEAIRK